jgi:hypothetical protein
VRTIEKMIEIKKLINTPISNAIIKAAKKEGTSLVDVQ